MIMRRYVQFLIKSKTYFEVIYFKAATCHHLIRKQTGVIYDDRMTLHECPWDPNYPEKPDRYRVVLER